MTLLTTDGGSDHADRRRSSPHRVTGRRGGAQGAARRSSAAPFIRNAAAAETTVWKVQTSWPAGVGLQTFKTWAGTIKEKTGGELEIKPFAAKEVVGDFELLDGVTNGVLEAMNSFTLYWAGKLPATAFLSSYLMGLRYPHEWDIFFYSKGGLQGRARDLRQAGAVLRQPHPSRPEHHPFEEADPHDRGLQGPEAARPGRHDRRRLRGGGRQDDAAAGRRSVLGARKGHDRSGRLHRARGQLGSRLPAGFEIHLDRPARTGIDLPAGRPDGLRRSDGRLEQAVAEDEGRGSTTRSRSTRTSTTARSRRPTWRPGASSRRPASRSTGCRPRTCRSCSASPSPIWFKWANKDKDAAQALQAAARGAWSRTRAAT